MSSLKRNKSSSSGSKDEEEQFPYSLKEINFKDNLAEMMYGFGDVLEPYPESIDALNELTKDFMSNLSMRCIEIAQRNKKGLDCEAIQYALRPKEEYYGRLTELLVSFDQISNQTRYQAEDDESVLKACKRKVKNQKKTHKRIDIEETPIEEV